MRASAVTEARGGDVSQRQIRSELHERHPVKGSDRP